jgi:hypothetical protein
MAQTTKDWLDLYDMMLDRGFEFAKDPVRGALARGITEKELEEQKSTARLPGKMQMDAYHALMESWKRVRTTIQIFGLEVGEDLELAPNEILETTTPAFARWMQKPWVEITRGFEKPLRFEGRDALTAVGFLNMYVQQCATIDPRKRIREALEAQGITKDNFHEHVGASGIRNPWEEDPPVSLKGTTP